MERIGEKMSKSKYKSILLIVFCIILIIISIGTSILSTEILHTEHCDVPDCSLCQLINLSIYFVRGFGLLYIKIFIFTVISLLTNYIVKKLKNIEKLTLVKLKVIQLN